jgi:hypothetical protein
MKKKASAAALPRKEQLRDRANRYAESGSMELGVTFVGLAQGYERGYRDALKDVRAAVGKSGCTRAMRVLLRPMR